MTTIAPFAAFNQSIVPIEQASLPITSAAVLYGLSAYTVVYAHKGNNTMRLFRLPEHLQRLRDASRLLGLSNTDPLATTSVVDTLTELIAANQPTHNQLIRITLHATDALPGVRTRDLTLALSIFMYEAHPLLPSTGAHLKTSTWRRVSDTTIPARAKVTGAYVNSALAKQDALDSGYDDSLILNQHGFVSELSTANVFLIKNGILLTPNPAADILEGITRQSIIELAQELEIPCVERVIAPTELYTADEAFACGTSTSIAPILSLDKRTIGSGNCGNITKQLHTALQERQQSENQWVTSLPIQTNPA